MRGKLGAGDFGGVVLSGCAGRWSYFPKEKQPGNAGQPVEMHVPLPGLETERSKTTGILIGPESEEDGWGGADGLRREDRVSVDWRYCAGTNYRRGYSRACCLG